VMEGRAAGMRGADLRRHRVHAPTRGVRTASVPTNAPNTCEVGPSPARAATVSPVASTPRPAAHGWRAGDIRERGGDIPAPYPDLRRWMPRCRTLRRNRSRTRNRASAQPVSTMVVTTSVTDGRFGVEEKPNRQAGSTGARSPSGMPSSKPVSAVTVRRSVAP